MSNPLSHRPSLQLKTWDPDYDGPENDIEAALEHIKQVSVCPLTVPLLCKATPLRAVCTDGLLLCRDSKAKIVRRRSGRSG